ncbi:MAG TPA: zinc-binding dehydrogenase [Steroidobacteraceae bacterium]
MEDWPDGTLADYTLVPVEALTPVDGLDALSSPQLAALSRFIIPFGGLLRGRLAAGEALAVTGATGAYGTAAVLLAIALGAARVIAIGRNAPALAATARIAGSRVHPIQLQGDVATDAAAIREVAGSGVDMAFDMVGNAADPKATLAALHSLRRGGRLVLMGSMTVDLPVPYTQLMLNGWEIIGQFMFPRAAYRQLIELVRSGQLAPSTLQPHVFPLTDLPKAMEASRAAGHLEYVVVQP